MITVISILVSVAVFVIVARAGQVIVALYELGDAADDGEQ